MSAPERITLPQEAEHAAAEAAILRALRAAIDLAARLPNGRQVIGEALCAAIDTVGEGAPRYDAFGNMREDASFWADCATPMELEIYAGAALKRIPRTTFAVRARKRLFNMLWRSFTDSEREGFLSQVTKDVKPP